MFKHYFEGIENVEVGPLFSLVLFFVVFLLVIFWIFRMDKSFFERMKNLPMDDSKPDSKSKIE